MSSTAPRRLRRLLARTVVLLFVLLVFASAWFVPRAGRFLIVEDPLAKSDAIVVLAGSRVERWLEAVDLYRDGWAPRVVLSPGHVEPAEALLRERGIPFPSDAELARDAMARLNVPATAVSILPHDLDNTAQEAEAVHRTAVTRGWRQVIIVTSKYHTRRTAFAFSPRTAGIRHPGDRAREPLRPVRPGAMVDAPAGFPHRHLRIAEAPGVSIRIGRITERPERAPMEANGARWPSRSSKPVAARVFAGGLGSTPRRFRHSTRSSRQAQI